MAAVWFRPSASGRCSNRKWHSPDRHTLGTHWGLGVILFEWDGRRVYGHDGGTIGQSSRLRIVPDSDLAIALVANGGAGTQQVYEELFGELVAELAGIAMPGPLQAPAEPPDVDLERFAGSYQRLSVRYDLAPEDGRLVGTVTLSGPIAEITPNPVTKVTFIPRRRRHLPRSRRGVGDPRPGGVLRVQRRDPPVPPLRRSREPPRRRLTRRSSAGTTNGARIWVRPRFGGSLTDHTVGAAPG